MVLDLENAKKALKQILNEQKEYQHILQAYDAFFQRERSHDNILEASLSLNEQSFNQALKQNEEHFKKSIRTFENTKNSSEQTLKDALNAAQSKYKKDIASNEEKYLIQKEKLEQRIETEKVAYQATIKTAQNESNKTLNKISLDIKAIKEKYNEDVRNIEKQFEEEKKSIQTTYSVKKKHLESQIKELKNTYEAQRKQKLEHKEQASTSHDEDYINIKTYYNELSKHLNQQITNLKRYGQEISQEISRLFEDKKAPLQDELDSLKTQVIEKKKTLEKSLKKTLKTFDAQKKKLDQVYDEKKKKLIVQTAESVSLLNSKLSNFKVITASKKQEIVKAFHKQSQQNSRVEISLKNKQLNALDDELNTLILKTKNEIKVKKIEGQLSLFEHEKAYQKSLSKHLYDKNRARLQSQFDMRQLDLSTQQHTKHIKDKMNRINYDSIALNKLLDIHKNYEMSKYEYQINIASETQERDLSQLTQDAYIDIANLDKDIEKDTFEYEQKLTILNHELALLQIKEDHDIELRTLTQSREQDKRSLIRNYDLEEQKEREELSKAIFERQTHEANTTHDEQVEQFKNELIKLEYTYGYDLQQRKYAYQKEIFDLKHQREQLLSENDMSMRALSFDRIEIIMNESLTYFTSFIKMMLNHHYHSFSQTKEIKYLLQDFYQTPAHPEALRAFLRFYEAQMKTFQENNSKIIARVRNQVTQKFETYIYDLIDHIKTIRYANLASEKSRFLESYAIKINQVNEDIMSYEVALKRLSTNSSEFKTLDKKYQQSLKSKKTLKSHKEKINQVFKRKHINFDLKIEKMTKNHVKYLDELKKLFLSHERGVITHYTHQLNIVSSLKKSLYMSDSTLKMSFRQSDRLEKVYASKLVFHEQALYETFTLHYELLLTLFNDEKVLHKQFNEQSIKTLTAKKTLNHSQHDTLLLSERRQFRKQLVQNKQLLEQKLKQNKARLTLRISELSKQIISFEQSLQTFEKRKNDAIAYHDINTEDVKDQEHKRFKKILLEVDESHHAALRVLTTTFNERQATIDANIFSTEQNIESRLTQYRVYISKSRESIHQNAHLYDQNLIKHDKVTKQKRIQLKRKTKKLLQSIQKEKRRFTMFKQQHERRLVKQYHKKQHDMIKLVTRAHKFKMRFLTFT